MVQWYFALRDSIRETVEYGPVRRWLKFSHRDRYPMLLLLIFFLLGVTNSDAISQCPALAVPQHAFLLSGHCERQVGSLCGLGCLTGYRLTAGDSLHECQLNGTWSGHPLKCEEIHCLPLKTDLRVIQECLPRQNGTNAKVGTKCLARCNENDHRLLGPRTRECLILGRWSGYEQFCIVNNETSALVGASTTTIPPSTTMISTYHDYSNLTLSVDSTDAGIALASFQPSQFSIVFWFYLRNSSNATLVSLRAATNDKVFEIVVRDSKLVYYHRSRNQTQPSLVKISSSKWTHFAWTYALQTKQSYLYIDGVRQQSFDFGIVIFDFKNVSSLILFGPPFDGLITRVEIWREKISEQQLLVSFRDCRKQIGNAFSWSKVPNMVSMDRKKLRASRFCFGCSEPASIHGGTYYVSDYRVGASVNYRCNFSYEMIGANRAFCMVPSEWHPLPPVCKYNPCTITCESCDRKTGVCLRQQTRFDSDVCDPPCDDDEECIDGECTWTNAGANLNSKPNDGICYPPCPSGTPCVQGRCQLSTTSSCPMPCRLGQQCVDGRCGCYRGVCDRGRPCYEVCEAGERCYNWSCSCGLQGKCGQGEACLSDICMCGTRRGGCQPHEHCVNGVCACKTSFCDQCGNTCKANEICLDGKCICKEQCEKAFCPFPCLNGGRCTGYYQCTCRQGWSGHRCERRQQRNVIVS